MPGMWWLGGHLGAAVSALVDGQLDEESVERAWVHVAGCASCRRLVEREGWVKRRLAEMAVGADSTPEPTSGLLGSLYDLEPVSGGLGRDPAGRRDHDAARAAWATVEALEQRDRSRRRVGLAVAGVGSVSVAVLGLGALGAAPLGIGGAPAEPPSSALTRATPTGGPAPASVSTPGRLSGTGDSPAPVAPSASASGAPTTGPFSGWRLRVLAEDVNGAVPVRSAR